MLNAKITRLFGLAINDVCQTKFTRSGRIPMSTLLLDESFRNLTAGTKILHISSDVIFILAVVC